MSEIDRVVEANQSYAVDPAVTGSGRPARRLAVVTCMDTRIDVRAALGLELGQAIVLRNAGGRITDDVVRSLALATHALGVDTVVVMQHTKCGLSGVSDAELQRMTGSDIEFLAIEDHTVALEGDLQKLTSQPFLGLVDRAAALLYDVETGKVEMVSRWSRA